MSKFDQDSSLSEFSVMAGVYGVLNFTIAGNFLTK